MKDSEKIYKLYCHTNKFNGKKYIGISKNPERRWENGYGYRGQVFYNAIEKYGWNNFEHEILYDGLSIDEAENLEIKCIQEMNSKIIDNGYNVDSGGRLSDSYVAREISQYDINYNFIKTWNSITEAGTALNISFSSIHSCCRYDNRYTAGGYVFRYYGEPFDKYRTTRIISHHTTNPKGCDRKEIWKAVNQYDKNMNFIKKFDAIKLAAKEINRCSTGITDCCKGKSKTCGGYKWEYVY